MMTKIALWLGWFLAAAGIVGSLISLPIGTTDAMSYFNETGEHELLAIDLQHRGVWVIASIGWLVSGAILVASALLSNRSK